MKKLSLVIWTVIICMVFSGIACFAEENVSVEINGVLQSYDQAPIIVNGRTLVPLRGIFETLGAKVEWDGETNSIAAVKDDTAIMLQIGLKEAYVNEDVVALEQEPIIVNDRTLVPLRFVGEALGAQVDWDGDKNLVIIKSDDVVPNKNNDNKETQNSEKTDAADENKDTEPDEKQEEKQDDSTAPADNLKLGEEILPDPGAEEDVIISGYWYGFAMSDVESVKSPVHSGKGAVICKKRTANWHGIGIEVPELMDAVLEAGSGTTYQMEGYLKTAETPMEMGIKLRVYTSDGQSFYLTATGIAKNDEWTKFSVTNKLIYSGEVTRVVMYADSGADQENNKQDFYADDWSLKIVK